MDRFRLVTFSPGGRPITRLDLNDGSIYTFVRDTLKFSAPERTQQWSEAIGRYGGAELTQESHKNAQLEAEWYIGGAGSADTALTRMEQLMVELESLETGRYLEWRPENATKSTYFPIKAPSAWEFMYRWIEFQSTKTLHLKGGWTVAPLAEGERMAIDDPFDVDSSADYTNLSGGALTYGAGNGLQLASTLRVGTQTARGYKYGDVRVIGKFRTGGAVAAGDEIGVTAGVGDANNYVFVNAIGTSFSIRKRVAGTETQLVGTAFAGLSASTTYYVVLRKEGNLVTAELWTANPLAGGAPLVTNNTTLAGGDITLFGSGTAKDVGYRALAATPTNWFLQEFRVDPYTYSSSSWPTRVDATPAVPGDAPALVTASVQQSGTVTPFAVLGWTKTPSAGTPPFGVFEAEAATLTTFASTADVNMRGGNGAKATTAGAGSGTLVFGFDPSLVQADDFNRSEIDVEVWARIQLASTVNSPVITTSVEPSAGTTFGPSRYTQEWGASGKLLTKPSSGSPYRLTRLGIVSFNTQQSSTWNLRLVVTWAASSSGTFGFDYVMLVPSQTRASSPTSKINDSTYPRFIQTASLITRQINPDLSTRTAVPGNPSYPDTGLGGAQLWLRPGLFSFMYNASEYAPDDPTVNSAGETGAGRVTATVSLAPIPRYFLPRGQ